MKHFQLILLSLSVTACTLAGLDDGLERQTCSLRADCIDLAIENPTDDPCREWTCNKETSFCQVKLRDADEDGFADVACGGGSDCDDDDPNSYPDAPETCDGKDNNCNGDADEGLFSATSEQQAVRFLGTPRSGPISMSFNPEDDDRIYAMVPSENGGRSTSYATWKRGESSITQTMSVQRSSGEGGESANIPEAGVRFLNGNVIATAASGTSAGDRTCFAVQVGAMNLSTLNVPDAQFEPGIAGEGGVVCPDATDTVVFPRSLAHDPSTAAWLSVPSTTSVPPVRQCTDSIKGTVLLSSPDADEATLVTRTAVGYEPFDSVQVDDRVSLMAVAEARTPNATGVFFYVVSGSGASVSVTALTRSVSALKPRRVRLALGAADEEKGTREVMLILQDDCVGNATVLLQRFEWDMELQVITQTGMPYQVIARSLADKPLIFGADIVWNGTDWFLAWNEDQSRVRMRRLTPRAEALVPADELTLFETDGEGGTSSPHVFLDSDGHPLVVAQSANADMPGIHEAVIECVNPS